MANYGPSTWYVRDNSTTPAQPTLASTPGTIGWSAVTPWSTPSTPAAGALRRQSGAAAVVVAGTGGVSSTTLTVASVTSGTVTVGQTITSTAAGAGSATITALGTGTGGAGTYTLSTALTITTGTTCYLGFVAGNERVFVCIISGAVGATEPAWVLTKGAKTVDGSATWMEVTGQPGVNGDNANATTATASSSIGSGNGYVDLVSTPANASLGQFLLDKTTAGAIVGKTKISLITTTRVYFGPVTGGSGTVSGDTIAFSNCPQWLDEASTVLTLGLVIQDKTGTHLFVVTTAGTAGSTEPAWNTTAGATTTDNTVTWTCIGLCSAFGAWAAPFARTAAVFGTAWAAAGSNIMIGDDHAETQASNVSLGVNFNVTFYYLYCMDHTASLPLGPANLKTTASITLTAAATISILGWIYFNGCILSGASGTGSQAVNVSSSGAPFCLLINCALIKTGTTGSPSAFNFVNGQVLLLNTTLQFGAVSDSFALGGMLVWKNTPSAIAGSVFPNKLNQSSNSISPIVLCDGVDFSAMASGKTLFGALSIPKIVSLINCLFGSGVTVAQTPTAIGEIVDVQMSDSAATNYQMQRYSMFGTLVPSTTIVRTGGASNGTTGLSLQITTTANASWLAPFESPQIAEWNTEVGQNAVITLHGLWNSNGGLLLSDMLWLDVEYMGSSGGPLSSLTSSTKANPLAVGAILTADSTSVWNSQCAARVNSQAYTAGQIFSVASSNLVFICVNPGTSAASLPGAYASATDASVITDGGATIRAASRFVLTVTLSSPQPQLVGYLRAIIKAAAASQTFWIDPLITIS